MNNLNWMAVNSSNLSRIAYDEDNQYLYIEFKSGKICLYKNVPQIEYENLMSSPSHGIYFNAYIRNAYPFEYV